MKILLIAFAMLATQSAFADTQYCFSQNQVRSFNAVDEHTLEVRAGKSNYVLDLNFCSEILWAQTIAFDNMGFSQVCAGDSVLVMDDFSNQIKQRCRIEKITKTK